MGRFVNRKKAGEIKRKKQSKRQLHTNIHFTVTKIICTENVDYFEDNNLLQFSGQNAYVMRIFP